MSFTSRGPKGQPEKGPKPKVDTPKYTPEKGQKKLGNKPTTNPNTKPINKIEPRTIPPNYKPKNKIEQHTLPPNYKPKNKIERHILPPNYKPKNKIERHTLPPNYKPKNKIKRPTLPPNYTPKNKIKPLTLPPNYTPRNKILGPGDSEDQPQLKPHNISKNPKSEPNHKPSNSPKAETRKNVTQSKWAFINYDKKGNKISREQKLQTAVDYFNKNILPELKKDPNINQKIEEKHSLGINDLARKGYSGFLNALSRDNKVNWSELKQALGYTNLNHKAQTTKYNFMNYNKENKPLNREQKIKIASDFYNNKILPDLKTKPEIREKIEAGKGIGYRDLEKYGYSKFHSALTRQGIHVKWNEFKEATGQKININQDKYRFINYHQNGNRLNREQKMEVALEHFTNKILPDLQKIPEIKQKLEHGEPPSMIEIRKYGYAGFTAPLCDKEPKINYNTLVKAAGLEPNIDHDKFRVLNYDINGKLISYEQKLENAKQFYTNEIIPNLVDKNIIKPGETPGIRELVKGGYSGFFPSLAFKGQKIYYNDLVTASGLKPNITQGRWDFIKYDQEGNILTKNEKLDNAVGYFSKNVYPDLVQKGIVKEGNPPTSLDLINNKHEDFLSALRGKEPKVSFNHFIEYAGFEPKSIQDHDKWKIFYDESNHPLPRDLQIKIAADYFKGEILQDLIKKDVLKLNQAPDTFTLKEFGHYDFFKAINRRGIMYPEVIIKAGLNPNSSNTLSAIGKDFHWNAEKIFLKHTRNQNCKSYYEVNKNGDNSIIIDEYFKKLSINAEFFAHIRSDIKIANFDYYLGASKKHAYDHSTRGYQGEEKALFLISVKINEPQPVEYQVPHERNIFILDPNNFAQFMGYQGDTLEEFMETVNLAKKAIYNEGAREILKEKAVESIEVIKNNQNDLNYSTKEFKEFL